MFCINALQCTDQKGIGVSRFGTSLKVSQTDLQEEEKIKADIWKKTKVKANPDEEEKSSIYVEEDKN